MKYFIPHGTGADEIVREVAYECARQTEESILAQLNDFISRGLIIVEQTGPIFVAEQDSARLSIRHSVNLKLKDKEYILSLERQLEELRTLVAKLREDKK